MIKLTVKTLDSQNHPFTLEEDMTVRRFKEHIAESVDIPADSQRLIYCGRVLQDDKKLNDYDVNGKVIHLVQRAPPQPGQRGQSSSQGQNSSTSSSQRSFRPRAEIHGNTMYLGSMSIPPEVMEGHGFAQRPRTVGRTLVVRKLSNAGNMLRKTNEVLDRLDNPSLPNPTNNPTPPDPVESPISQHIQIQTVDYTRASSSNPSPRVTTNERMAEAVSAALTAAGLSNVTVFRASDDDAENEAVDEPQQAQPSQSQEQQQQAQPQQSASQEQTLPDQQRRGLSGRNRPHPSIVRGRPRLEEMRQMLDRYLQTQDRMRPYVERYRDIMRDDPRVGTDEHQRIIDGVSESLHHMAHACHSLSDMFVVMNQHPPRRLRCHPLILQHSAILQAGIPIQVEAHINMSDRNPQATNNNNENNESEQSNNTQSAPATSATSAAGSASTDESARRPDTPNVSQQSNPVLLNAAHGAFSSLFALPNNVEVLMEVSPEAAMDTASGEEMPQNNGAPTSNVNHRVSGARITAGTIPFLQNLMQAVAGHVVQTSGGIPNVNFSTGSNNQQTTASENNGGTSGQSVQARSNLETHLTNSVLTRTTPRPQVFHPQAHPLDIGSFGMNLGPNMDFDPFLSCNSHHIRPRLFDDSNADSNASATSTSAQPSQSSQTAASAETPSQPATPTSTSNATPPSNSPQQLLNNVAGRTTTDLGSMAEAAMGLIFQLLTGEFVQRASGSQGETDNSGVRGLTLAQILQHEGLEVNSASMGGSFIGDLRMIIAEMTVGEVMNLSLGRWISIGRFGEPLREFFRRTFPDVCEDSLAYNATNRLIEELRPFVENILQFDEAMQSRVNLVETVLNIIKTGILRILNLIFQFDAAGTPESHEAFNADCTRTVTTLAENLTAVIRHSLPGGQAFLETIVSRFANNFFEGTSPPVRSLMVRVFVAQFHGFSAATPQPPFSEIVPLLVYRTQQVSTSQRAPEPEPMEVETVNEKVNDEVIEDNEIKPEDIPRTFPGHEILPPDWVPVIARDTVAQRREVNGGGLTPFSDAYLSGLPTKRRKLIEQQKPRLLASAASNSAPVTASLERLVKECTTRAGVDEVEGAVAAVASDPGVRSAFGQAIKDCLKPKKPSADFPDAARFPNATKYFGDDDRAKQ